MSDETCLSHELCVKFYCMKSETTTRGFHMRLLPFFWLFTFFLPFLGSLTGKILFKEERTFTLQKRMQKKKKKIKAIGIRALLAYNM